MSLRVFLAQGDEVVERSVGSPLAAITRYLALRMPEILSHSIPFAVLLATLITLSGMQRQNELTAMKSFGIDRKSTRLNSVTNAHLVCRLLLEKKKTNNNQRAKQLKHQLRIT